LEEPVCKYWAHHSSSLPTTAAQLLGEPAAGEPYNILIMVYALHTFIDSSKQGTASLMNLGFSVLGLFWNKTHSEILDFSTVIDPNVSKKWNMT
jgi:hypothetical protein